MDGRELLEELIQRVATPPDLRCASETHVPLDGRHREQRAASVTETHWVVLPRRTSKTPARPRSASRWDGPQRAPQPRGSPRRARPRGASARKSPLSVHGSHTRHDGLGAHVEPRDRRLAVAANVGHASRELDGRAASGVRIDRDQRVC